MTNSSPAILQLLDDHIAILHNHVEFLLALQVKDELTSVEDFTTRFEREEVTRMIHRASTALDDARTCAKVFSKTVSEEASTTSPSQEAKLPMRTKRLSTTATDVVEETRATKRRRSSKGRRESGGNSEVPRSELEASAGIAAQGKLQGGIVHQLIPDVEYDDISAEVEARLQQREQRRRMRIEEAPPTTIKRKRKSSMNDSVVLGTMESTVGNGVKRRISGGKDRKIKKMKTSRSTESGRRSIIPLAAQDLPVYAGYDGLARAPEANDEQSRHKDDVKLKKRRRSSHPAGQAATDRAPVVEERSAKRRRG